MRKKKSVYRLFCQLLVFVLFSCQTPLVTQTASPALPRAFDAELSPSSLLAAKQKLRPNTKDRLALIRDDKQRVISWAVIYNPPKVVENTSEPNFSTQATYAALEDMFPHREQVLVAEFLQPINISYGEYEDWYGTGHSPKRYGGWKNHPDLWISNVDAEGERLQCSGQYSLNYNGSTILKFAEQRYAGESHYRNLPGLRSGTLKFTVPRSLIGDNNTAFLRKSAACDGTSKQLSVCIMGDCENRPAVLLGEPYCKAFLLDQLKSSFYFVEALTRELDALSENLATGAFDLTYSDSFSDENEGFINEPVDDFETQSLTQPFIIASSDPGSSSDYGDDELSPDVPGVFRAVKKETFEKQIDYLKGRINALQSQATGLQLGVINLKNPTLRDTYSRMLNDAATELQSRNTQMGSLKEQLPVLCPKEESPDPQPLPEVDILYVGFTANEDLLISGRVQFIESNADLIRDLKLTLDFNGDLELSEGNVFEPVVDRESGLFTVTVPFGAYRFTEQYLNAFALEGASVIDFSRIPDLSLSTRSRFEVNSSTYYGNGGSPVRIDGQDIKIYGLCATPGFTANYYCARLGQPLVNHRVIDMEAVLEALKNSNSDAAFNNIDTQRFYLGTIIYVGASNTLLEVAVPTSLLDVIPGEKFAGLGYKSVRKYGGKVWEKGSNILIRVNGKKYLFNKKNVFPGIYEGQLFFNIRNVNKKVWDESLGKAIPEKYHSIDAPVNKFVTNTSNGAFDSYRYIVYSLPGLKKDLKNLGALDNSYLKADVEKAFKKIEQNISAAKAKYDEKSTAAFVGTIGQTAGAVYELQLLKKFLKDEKVIVHSFSKDYAIAPHLMTDSIKTQQVDMIISVKKGKNISEKIIVEAKTNKGPAYQPDRKQLARLASVAQMLGIEKIKYVTGTFDFAAEKKVREAFQHFESEKLKISTEIIPHD